MMRVARIVIQNFRTFASLDVNVADDLCCIIGENNTGKTAILRAIQICLDCQHRDKNGPGTGLKWGQLG